MRYFIAKSGSTVVEKQAVSGDDSKIDSSVNNYKLNHQNFSVTEVDETTFDATVLPVQQTKAQKDWTEFKAQQPTPSALQGILYLARYLGLE